MVILNISFPQPNRRYVILPNIQSSKFTWNCGSKDETSLTRRQIRWTRQVFVNGNKIVYLDFFGLQFSSAFCYRKWRDDESLETIQKFICISFFLECIISLNIIIRKLNSTTDTVRTILAIATWNATWLRILHKNSLI